MIVREGCVCVYVCECVCVLRVIVISYARVCFVRGITIKRSDNL